MPSCGLAANVLDAMRLSAGGDRVFSTTWLRESENTGLTAPSIRDAFSFGT